MAPASSRLLRAWAYMMALSAAAIPVGRADDMRPLGAALTLLLLAATFMKVAILMNHYLDLRRAAAWNRALRASAAVLLIVIAALSLIARLA
ncbi:MAG: hypothetical protein JNK46_08425 [Methylobacteriaceae bacterium]|nr:hypothetical protein [Methylobacteriaceae bacterium]